MRLLLARSSHVLAPFTDLGSKTGWPYLLTGLVALLLVWAVGARRDGVGFRRFAFPGSVYAHPSAKVDYRFVAIDFVLRAVVYLHLIMWVGAAANRAVLRAPGIDSLSSVTSHLPARGLVVGLTLFLATDFALFFGHWAMHRVPSLWAFHEVHHSAQVLTPLTVHRFHPVEDVLNYVAVGVLGGAATAVYGAATATHIGLPTVYGVNVLTALFYAFAFQLRHSHVWLSYGRWSRLFVSPAQHQIHHSVDPRHWDRNMGFVLSIWDRAFGTLYVPVEREAITFGLGGEPTADFDSVPKLYLLPFVKAVKRMPWPGVVIPPAGPGDGAAPAPIPPS